MRHDSVTFVVSERVPLNGIPTLHYSNRSEVELEVLFLSIDGFEAFTLASLLAQCRASWLRRSKHFSANEGLRNEVINL